MARSFPGCAVVLLLGPLTCSAIGCTGAVRSQGPGSGEAPTGQGGSSSDVHNGRGNDPPEPGDKPSATAPESAGWKPVRRLNRHEYNNTVRDLLGVTSRPADAFADDVRGEGGFFSPNPVSGVETSAYRTAAESLAAEGIKSTPSLAACAKPSDESKCADFFIATFGRRAFRRPLRPVELQALKGLYDDVRAAPLNAPHAEAVEVLISAILQAPQFLYHGEAASEPKKLEGDLVKLDGYELASRLSYFLWSSMPDEPLLEAAEAGELDSVEAIAKHAERLLADPRAADSVTSFFSQLYDLDRLPKVVKDKTAFPNFTATLPRAMAEEMIQFVRFAVLEEGSFSALMTSSVSFVNEELAKVYGKAGVVGDNLRKVDLDRSQRFGLLTKGAFLALHANTYETSPVMRGKIIVNRILCEGVPPPPDNVDTSVGAPKPNEQTRERFEVHSKNPACAACHKLMDPLGFALESYNGMASFRTQDAGRPVRTDGTLALESGTVNLKDARGLVDFIANSAQGRDCMVRQWLRFGLGRGDVVADGGSLGRAMKTFEESNGSFKDLLLSLVQSKTFRFRTLAEGEVL